MGSALRTKYFQVFRKGFLADLQNIAALTHADVAIASVTRRHARYGASSSVTAARCRTANSPKSVTTF